MSLETESAVRRDSSMEVNELSSIFVVGTPRSGTTLTSRILGNHPEICSIGESNYFEDIWSRKNEIGPLHSEQGAQQVVARLMTLFARYHESETQERVDELIDPEMLLERILQSDGGYDTVYKDFMGILARAKGASYLCDDTPKHLFFLADIFELFPPAKVIVCVRDIRDYLLSYQNWWKRSPAKERIKTLYHPIMTSMLWRSSMNVASAALDTYSDKQVMLLRYEDLVTQPKARVKQLCDFLEIGYSDKLLDLHTNNSSFEQSSSGIFSSSVGRWREELGKEDVWWAQWITQDAMLRFDYRSVSVKPSPFKLVRHALTLPGTFVEAMRANDQHRGPTLQYLQRRLRHLLRA